MLLSQREFHMQNINNLSVTDPQYLQSIANKMVEKLAFQLALFDGQFPAACSVDGVYPLTPNTDWTTGFWSGITALAAGFSEADRFLPHLEKQVSSFTERLAQQHDLETHDLGFLYSLSCVNAWRMTGNPQARRSALLAADALMKRYHPKAGIIQAWGDLQDPEQQGRMIIDCMMNLPLLYWASEQSGNPDYARCAYSHALQAQRYLFRQDNSTFHTFYMDVLTGQPIGGKTHQGYADNSCWARGQAWAIYGSTLSYSYSGDKTFLASAKRAARYFLAHLPADGICYWDLSLTQPETNKDTSAAIIAVCGLLELANHLSVVDPERSGFIQQAIGIIDTLLQTYFDGEQNRGGYLTQSVYNMNKKRGVGEYSTWGDYFLFEATSRLISPEAKYW